MADRTPEFEACWRQALKLLRQRLHSRQELSVKLRQRGHAREVVAATLAEAERLRLVDDAAFAEAYREELRRKGLGEMRVRVALRRRGVASANLPGAGTLSADEADHEADDERRRARAALARKRAALARESDPRKRREKLMRFLLGRGFAIDLVREVVDGEDDAEG